MKIRLEFITPVHIGSGEYLNPFDYVIKDNYCYRINYTSFLDYLSATKKEEFNNLINNNRFIELRKFIVQNFNPSNENSYLYKTSISKNFKDAYLKNIDNPENKLVLQGFIRRGDYKPFIPGSSIKGAIRTAVLNYILENKYLKENVDIESKIIDAFKNISKKHNINNRDIDSKKIEYFLLNNENAKINIPNDPFRLLEIPDITLSDNDDILVEQIVNRRIKGNKLTPTRQSWQMFYEITNSKVTTNLQSSIFTRTLVINFKNVIRKKLKNLSNNKLSNIISFFLDEELIIKACNSFYKKIALNEYKKYFETYIPENLNEIKKIMSLLGVYDENSNDRYFILRLGRFVHKESMTFIDLNKIKKIKDKKVSGKSRYFVNDHIPLGWVKVHIVKQD